MHANQHSFVATPVEPQSKPEEAVSELRYITLDELSLIGGGGDAVNIG